MPNGVNLVGSSPDLAEPIKVADHDAVALEQAPDSAAILGAIDRTNAIISFLPDGTIVSANDQFLSCMGYTREEVVGSNHSMFMARGRPELPAYRECWADLASGECKRGEFCRIHKSGRQVWIAATYTPVLDDSGRVVLVVKVATDVTARKTVVDQLVQKLRKLADGDTTVRWTDDVTGEFADIRDVFNDTVQNLERIVSGVVGSALNIRNVSDAVRVNADELADRSQEQSAALGQTSAVLRELSGGVSRTSDAASQVDRQATAAAAKSRRGGEIVASTMEAISGIEEIARSVSQNTKVIEQFAFQTNLLSINAAVEAARAGDSGRGFAVVAAEVRSLAQRSAEASQCIKELTERCEKMVASGAELARSAGVALAEIEGAVNVVVSEIGQVAAASREQATSIAAVEASVDSLGDNLRGFIALSADGVSQSSTLLQQVDAFDETLSQFQQGQALDTSPRHWAAE
ncbi:PAS domain-containing methyl-accepting chemotaxis protein [Actibacterium sp. 188UL27-1]|uniref:methyl-accepting chemotaxis protein n=1 Tax=Actibacterium sp. 188UL27-1 TaxID=2786961 RepID=UPI001959A0BE|nr:PAS domain-containing methyl-accepting chemotaxis protein [Actibacterium sp. 188UL27-1]MBM7068795.1 PAS domain-containing protein [Actibacterium sp. 188UL27-1]